MQVANTLVPPLVSYKTVEFLNLVSFYIASYIWYFILSIKPDTLIFQQFLHF